MAGSPRRGSVRRSACVPAVVLALAFGAPLGAQTRLTLEQVNTRKVLDLRPVHEGEKVTVRGVVNAPSFHFPDYTLLSIQEDSSGAILQVPESDKRLESFHAGEEVEVSGTVTWRAGAVTIVLSKIDVVGWKAAPTAIAVTLR